MQKGTDIAIIMPTRGLVFTEVEEAIEKARRSSWRDISIYRSHNKTIPDCLNELVEEALRDDPRHIWFIEEDTVPPDNALDELLKVHEDIAYIDYGVAGWSCSAKDRTGNTLWCGFGCTMVKKDVFKKVAKPWFRSDKVLRYNPTRWEDIEDEGRYGGHDIWFFSQAREAGCTFKQVAGECRHLKLNALGVPERNKGLHDIGQKPMIEKYQINSL